MFCYLVGNDKESVVPGRVVPDVVLQKSLQKLEFVFVQTEIKTIKTVRKQTKMRKKPS